MIMSNSSNARVRFLLLLALAIPGTCHASGEVSTGGVLLIALLFVGAIIFSSRRSLTAQLLHGLFKAFFGMFFGEEKPHNEVRRQEKPSAASVKPRISRWKWLVLLVAILGLRWIPAAFYPSDISLSFFDQAMAETQPRKLEFTCVYEADLIPQRDPEADQLYQHAKWLKQNNSLKEDPLVYSKIERLVRIATAYGHDKASLELSRMIGAGTVMSDKGTQMSDDVVDEALRLAKDLIKRGIPGGYYNMAQYLELGYGVKENYDLAVEYNRKAADMGNPDAQYDFGDWLAGSNNPAAQKIGLKMLRCAVEQGHGEAGVKLGNWLKAHKTFPEALQAYQLGAKAGNNQANSFLEDGFNGPKLDDPVYYLGQQKDPERVKRYKAIGSFLDDYYYLNPKVPEIDSIVPLPPAKLPAWDGTFQWLKAHDPNVPPPLPPKERIKEMAIKKGLDPETGRPGKR